MGIVMNLYARVSMWLVSDMGEEEIKPPTDVEEEELIDIIEAGEKEGLDKVSVPLALLKRVLSRRPAGAGGGAQGAVHLQVRQERVPVLRVGGQPAPGIAGGEALF